MEQEVSIQKMEENLSQYKGGEVILCKEYCDTDGIALVVIKHVEKRNAFSGKMMVDFRKVVLELEKWKTGKAVILVGEATNFSSGGDLDFVRVANTSTDAFYMSFYMHDVIKKFRNLPFITVSLVHGPALGGGAEVSVFSDYIVVADDVKLGFVEGKMGVMTGWGGGPRLFEILGQSKALEMLLTSKLYNAQECLDMGLAHKIVKSNNKLEETLNFVKTLTVHHYSIIHSYKKLSQVASKGNFDESLETERTEFIPKWGAQLQNEILSKKVNHIKDKKAKKYTGN